jgi:hypothetical protein
MISVTKSFNEQFRRDAKANDFIFVDIYKCLIDKEHKANLEFYMDEVHLSQKVMPFVVSELKKYFPAVFEAKDRQKRSLINKLFG